MIIITPMADAPSSPARLRLLQLVSPALPIGGFTYSQGLEWAVEYGAVRDTATLADWMQGLMEDSLAYLDIPILKRLYQAFEAGDNDAVRRWSALLVAARESKELRQEELNRARALASLLPELGLPDADKALLQTSQSAGFACAAQAWGIPLDEAAHGFAWSWLENQIAAAIKLVPLGQTEGQRVQFELAEHLPAAIATGMAIEDTDIGASSPALAMASALHETQYTRLFRS
ncbi:MAG: urease accessory protein UreF [Gammaproteobacteria bacterium]